MDTTLVPSDELASKALERWPRFLAFTLFSAVVCLAAAAGVVAGTAAAGRRPLPYRALVEHQMTKLEGLNASTLFVGDSSLGNAVDAGIWSELSGRSATNLALTGVYGYAGSQAMLEKALEHTKPDLVVLMQTAEMPKRPPAEPAMIETVSGSGTGFAEAMRWWRLNMNLQELRASIAFLRKRGLSVFAASEEPTTIANDYVEQGAPRPVSTNAAAYEPSDINPEQMKDLAAFASLCHSRGIRCLYAHGPLAEPICSRSAEYITAVNRMIEEIGLAVLKGTPICIPPGQLGDSSDHVLPRLKGTYTTRYFSLVDTQVYGRL